VIAVRPIVALALVLCVAAGAPVIAASAQDDAPRIAAFSFTPDTATVGDHLALRIEVEHARGVTVEGPRFGENFGPFEIVDAPPPERHDTRTIVAYTMTTFETGAIALPPLTVTWRGAAGAGTLTTEPRTVQVRSVLAPGDEALRPLKPQLALSQDAPSPVTPVLFSVAMVALTLFGYWLMRRAAGTRPAVRIPLLPVVAPGERARAQLDELAAAGAAGPGLRAHYGRLAAIVRGYLSERFGFPGYAMTRREMERGMARAGIDRFVARVTANLLEQCDAVQFAGFEPPPQRVDADLTAAYEIVAMTAPEEPPPAPAPHPAAP